MLPFDFLNTSNLSDFSLNTKNLDFNTNPDIKNILEDFISGNSFLTHYIDESIEEDNFQLNLKPLNSCQSSNDIFSLAREKKIVIIENVDNILDFRFDPQFAKKFQHVKQINIEDKNGNVKKIRNNIDSPTFTISEQSGTEMLLITKYVNYIASSFFTEKNKQENELKENLTAQDTNEPRKITTTSSDLKDRNIQLPNPKNNSINPFAMTFMKQNQIIATRRQEDKERQKVEESIKMRRWIVIQEALDFNLQQDAIHQKDIKTITQSEEVLKSSINPIQNLI